MHLTSTTIQAAVVPHGTATALPASAFPHCPTVFHTCVRVIQCLCVPSAFATPAAAETVEAEPEAVPEAAQDFVPDSVQECCWRPPSLLPLPRLHQARARPGLCVAGGRATYEQHVSNGMGPAFPSSVASTGYLDRAWTFKHFVHSNSCLGVPLQELFLVRSKEACTYCGLRPGEAALCLICDAVMCVANSVCRCSGAPPDPRA